MRPYLENTHHKKGAGREAQVVELLPSKCEPLHSNPSTPKRKKSINKIEVKESRKKIYP
jgi:hypothetical protein